MKIDISANLEEMGAKAAREGADLIRQAIEANGTAHIILATGASQFEMIKALAKEDMDWPKVTVFHLDEYISLPITHPASFRKYLKERFVEALPRPVQEIHYINGEDDPEAECRRLNKLISAVTIDVAFVGIGENGHLAFNDPPADFDVAEPYIIVDLDAACRKQQLGEGWFDSLDDVPRDAISMSIRQIMKSRTIICTVPDERKAEAVQKTLEGPVTPDAPASILQEHADCRFFMDMAAASRLSR